MKTTLVLTTINPPTPAVLQLADGCVAGGWDFVIAGDEKTPEMVVPGAEFLSLDAQARFPISAAVPTGSYSRKNLGYLRAIERGAEVIVETDDDNFPLDGFWEPRKRLHASTFIESPGWTNAYAHFSDSGVWPRGLPLTEIRNHVRGYPREELSCPVQQGLADGDPDVDAVWRLIHREDTSFRDASPLLLYDGVWCPFNSQNTTWFREVFPLLYLPSTCSFRMCDIWRSFVAQRILHELGYGVLFHSATMRQERNEHDLMADFRDEVEGYLYNDRIRTILRKLDLSGLELNVMMVRCYQVLIECNLLEDKEMMILVEWLKAFPS